MKAWWAQYEELPITAKDVFNLAKDESLLLDLWAGRRELGAQQRIGHALSRRMDRIFGRYQICFGGEGATQNKAYRLKIIPTGGRNKTPETPETPPSRYENEDSEGGVLKRCQTKTPPRIQIQIQVFQVFLTDLSRRLILRRSIPTGCSRRTCERT